MGPHVSWPFVTYYLTCILCKNVFGESSTFAKVFASINDTSEMDMKSIFETENIRLNKIQTSPDGIILKDDWSKPEILQDSAFVKSASKIKILSTHSSRRAKCSKYCIQKLRIGQEKNNSFEDDNICISWFAGNTSEEVDFSLENNGELNVSRQISIDNKNLILLNKCQIYLDLDYNIINIKKNSTNEHNKFSNLYFNHRNIESPRSFPNASQFSKKLIYRTNLSGYTETNFHIDSNINRIIINILGNITHTILAIPINGAVRRLGVIMSLAQTHNTKGVVIGARSLPSGEYCMKITGMENSKYDFDVIIFFETNKENNGTNDITDNELTKEFNMYDKKKDFDESGRKYIIDGKTAVINKTERFNKLEKENISNDQISSIFLTDFGIKSNLKSIFERSIEIKDQTNNDEETTIYELPVTFLSTEWNQFAVENVTNYSTLHNSSLTNYGEFRNPQNTSKKIFDGKAFTINQRQKIQMQTSEVTSLNEDVDMNTKSFAIENIPTKVNNSDYNQELSSDFTKSIHEDVFIGRNTLIDVNVNSNLIIAAGKRTHKVIFDVSNKCFLSVKYTINAKSLSFRILNIYPTILWLHPGQTSQVTVDIFIPPENRNTVDIITLFIEGTEIMKKSVYVFVQNVFTKNDNVKPTIEYSFNSNCLGKTDKYRCERTFWSADIIVQDSDSGLQRIISTPNAIYPRKMFISGTKDPVEFYYFSTCCFTTVEITAIDVTNNQNTRMLDVTVWDNLSQGEIAAVTLGALLLLLLLILLIIVTVRCFRKRNSHNLPYTQRYGSRPPARSE